MTGTRTESDSLGPVEVPAAAYWGAQTQRSIANFPFAAQEHMPIAIIHAIAAIKLAAARVNREYGLPPELAAAIEQAAQEVMEGRHDGEFPLSIWQSGSGTQSHMNVNEVIAGRANELLGGTRGGKTPVHPNDHVNRSQSSNDSFPTALHIATVLALDEHLLPALDQLAGQLEAKSRDWAGLMKIGRTHLQDATPLSLGQEFSGYAAQVSSARARIGSARDGLLQIAQGGTAVGTGINAPAGFAQAMASELARITGLALAPARNSFEANATSDALVAVSGALSGAAASLNKIANDVRLLASGPRAGIGELVIPANEPGSSIMPGKVNPTQCEMLTMVAAQVIANHGAVTLGGMQGQLELNTFRPLMGANVLRSIHLLAVATSSFCQRTIKDLTPDRGRLADLLDRSLMLVTALVPVIGYEKSARIAQVAQAEGITLREAAIKSGYIADQRYDELIASVISRESSR